MNTKQRIELTEQLYSMQAVMSSVLLDKDCFKETKRGKELFVLLRLLNKQIKLTKEELEK